MKYPWFSNKNSKAPAFYLLLHSVLLGGLIFTCDSIQEFTSSKLFYLFCIDVVITVVLYFAVHWMDPGYIPFDGVFFTDQEEPPLSASNHHMKYDSMMKLKNADSRIMFQSFDMSPVSVDPSGKQRILLSSPENNAKMKFSLSSTAITKQGDNTLNSPLQSTFKLQEVEVIQSPYIEEDVGEEEEGDCHARVDVCETKEIETQANEQIDYQATYDEDDNPEGEFSPHDIHSIEDQAPEIQREISQNNTKRAPNSLNDYGKFNQLDDVEEEHDVDTSQAGQETQDETHKVKKYQGKQPASMEVDKSIILAQQEQVEIDSVGKSKGEVYVRQQGGNIEFLTTREGNHKTVNTARMNGKGEKQIELSVSNPKSIVLQINDSGHDRKINQNTRSSAKGRSDPSLDKSELDNAKKEEGPETLYVERRYCTACSLDQPLRSKHCKDCNKCTAQYDHHCPWVGTCIGEKNHLTFYFFLIFQLVEIVWGEIFLAEDIINQDYEKEWRPADILRMFTLVISTFFLVMVGSLTVFHTYLATQNLTTWEFFSWNKISYLREWESKWGSPFSQGFVKNLAFFFHPKKDLRRWKMPKYKAPIKHQTQS